MRFRNATGVSVKMQRKAKKKTKTRAANRRSGVDIDVVKRDVLAIVLPAMRGLARQKVRNV